MFNVCRVCSIVSSDTADTVLNRARSPSLLRMLILRNGLARWIWLRIKTSARTAVI